MDIDDLRIPPEVAHRLGFYVYLYVDPRDNKPFYVGKGKESRALSHLSEAAESRKCTKIAELRAIGYEPRIDILAHALRDEETAFRIEAAVIDLLGLEALRFVDGSVTAQFRRGLRSPVVYVNC